MLMVLILDQWFINWPTQLYQTTVGRTSVSRHWQAGPVPQQPKLPHLTCVICIRFCLNKTSTHIRFIQGDILKHTLPQVLIQKVWRGPSLCIFKNLPNYSDHKPDLLAMDLDRHLHFVKKHPKRDRRPAQSPSLPELQFEFPTSQFVCLSVAPY